VNRFTITDLPLAGLKLVQRQRLGDARGFLSRLFCADELVAAGCIKPVIQINHTYTAKRGTVRGMHFQHAPHAEMKLINCIRGEIWDVAVDLRENSPTFLKWHAERLSAENGLALLVPEGFAHGFQALTDDVEMLYCHTMSYNASAEAGVNPQDLMLDIEWPLEITEISMRDQNHPRLNQQFSGLEIA
jgi:dTDP-4-dehydrorhamnose 3,5-epimerase